MQTVCSKFWPPPGWPPHPWRISIALILTGVGSLAGFPLNCVFITGALRLLWDLE